MIASPRGERELFRDGAGLVAVPRRRGRHTEYNDGARIQTRVVTVTSKQRMTAYTRSCMRERKFN